MEGCIGSVGALFKTRGKVPVTVEKRRLFQDRAHHVKMMRVKLARSLRVVQLL